MAKRRDAIDLDQKVEEIAGDEGLRMLCNWIAATSLWTNPEVYRQIHVIHPRTRRLSGREVFRSEVDGNRVWRNEPAANAFWKAYGVSLGGSSPRSFKNIRLCHIYEQSAHDPGHFTNLANLTVVPKALESFTEWEPIRKLLKWQAFQLYGYRGPAGRSPSKPDYVPDAWPGVKTMTVQEVGTTVDRLKRIRAEHPGHITPRSKTAQGS